MYSRLKIKKYFTNNTSKAVDYYISDTVWVTLNLFTLKLLVTLNLFTLKLRQLSNDYTNMTAPLPVCSEKFEILLVSVQHQPMTMLVAAHTTQSQWNSRYLCVLPSSFRERSRIVCIYDLHR